MNTPRRSVLAILFLFLLTSPTYAREAEGPQQSIVAVAKPPAASVRQRLDDKFYSWETYELDLPAIERQVRRQGRVDLYLGGRWLELDLHPNNLRAPGYRRVVHTEKGVIEEVAPPVATYGGQLRDDPQSEVRLLIKPGFLQGFIKTADEFLFIDPLAKYGQGEPASHVVVFDDADVKPGAALTCGTGEIAHRAGLLREDLGSSSEDSSGLASVYEEAVLGTTTLREIEIATDADYEYYALHPVATHDLIEGILNVTDFYFRRDLGATLRITYQNVWTSTAAPYPYTLGPNPPTNYDRLLAQFKVYWQNNVPYSRDVAHLFTGKPPAVIGVTGLSYYGLPGSICADPATAYSFSQENALHAVVVAHEVGHNLGAEHDLAANCPDPNLETGPIMCAYLQSPGSKRFSSFSKGQIGTYINNHGSCLASVPLKSLFTTQTPAETLDTGGLRFDVATQFSSSTSGYVMALRFWKAPGETGSHTATLWTDTGGKLGEVTFENETSSGWQEQHLATPVFLTGGVRYRVSFNTNTKQAKTPCGLQGTIVNGTLTAWQGFYKQYVGGSSFPTNQSCSNFFADVYFTATGGKRRSVRH